MTDSWKTTADDSSQMIHLLRTVSTFASMAADDIEREWDQLASEERAQVAEQVNGLIAAAGELVNLETNYPALRVLTDR